jgi:hypothetical protein
MTRTPHPVDPRQPRRPRQTSGPGYTHGYIAGRAAGRAANRRRRIRRRSHTITVICLLAVLCLTLLVVTR